MWLKLQLMETTVLLYHFNHLPAIGVSLNLNNELIFKLFFTAAAPSTMHLPGHVNYPSFFYHDNCIDDLWSIGKNLS